MTGELPLLRPFFGTLLKQSRYVRRYTGESVATLFQFKEPVSPHVAARGAECIVSRQLENLK